MRSDRHPDGLRGLLHSGHMEASGPCRDLAPGSRSARLGSSAVGSGHGRIEYIDRHDPAVQHLRQHRGDEAGANGNARTGACGAVPQLGRRRLFPSAVGPFLDSRNGASVRLGRLCSAHWSKEQRSVSSGLPDHGCICLFSRRNPAADHASRPGRVCGGTRLLCPDGRHRPAIARPDTARPAPSDYHRDRAALWCRLDVFPAVGLSGAAVGRPVYAGQRAVVWDDDRDGAGAGLEGEE